MALSDLISTSADDDIGGFDQNEADDLKLHVRQCARRYRALDKKLTLAIRLMLIIVALHLLTSIPGGWAFVAKLLASP